MKNLKSLDYQILTELINNSRISDRQLARKIGVSQPTITRRRTALEKARLLEYTAIPDLEKLDFEILAITFADWNHDKFPDEKTNQAKTFLSKHSCMMFMSTGRGLGFDRVYITAHKGYSDYARFMRDLKKDWEQYMNRLDSFMVSLKSDNILRRLTFKCLAESIVKETKSPEIKA